MLHNGLLLLVFMIVSLHCAAQQKKYVDYSYPELAKACQVVIKIPRGFSEVPVTSSNDQLYQYALKDAATGFEVRYYLKPYSIFFQNDSSFIKDPKTYSFFVSSLLNVSGMVLPDVPNIQEDVDHGMGASCNADYALASIFKPHSKFSVGFENCAAVVLRKDNVGEVVIFMLFNTINRETEVIIDDVMASIDFN